MQTYLLLLTSKLYFSFLFLSIIFDFWVLSTCMWWYGINSLQEVFLEIEWGSDEQMLHSEGRMIPMAGRITQKIQGSTNIGCSPLHWLQVEPACCCYCCCSPTDYDEQSPRWRILQLVVSYLCILQGFTSKQNVAPVRGFVFPVWHCKFREVKIMPILSPCRFGYSQWTVAQCTTTFENLRHSLICMLFPEYECICVTMCLSSTNLFLHLCI